MQLHRASVLPGLLSSWQQSEQSQFFLWLYWFIKQVDTQGTRGCSDGWKSNICLWDEETHDGHYTRVRGRGTHSSLSRLEVLQGSYWPISKRKLGHRLDRAVSRCQCLRFGIRTGVKPSWLTGVCLDNHTSFTAVGHSPEYNEHPCLSICSLQKKWVRPSRQRQSSPVAQYQQKCRILHCSLHNQNQHKTLNPSESLPTLDFGMAVICIQVYNPRPDFPKLSHFKLFDFFSYLACVVGVYVCFVSLTVEPSLSWNLLQYTPNWPQTQRSASLCCN